MRLRDGESTLADWLVLAKRFVDAQNINYEQFSDATCILPQKVDVAEFNINKLKSLKFPIAKINAVHTGGDEACKANPDVTRGLHAHLLLAKGARVMLIANL